MKTNVPIALASVFLSIMLWFVVYVQNVPEPIPVRAIIAYDGLNDALFFVRKAPVDLRLDVSMPAERAKELADQQVVASVDLSDPQKGTHDYPVAISPAWVARYLSGPRPVVRVVLEPIARRTMAVNAVVKGTLSDPNLRLNEKHALPEEVTLYGPESEVASVREARVYLDLSQVNPSNPGTQESDVIPLDRNGIRPAHVRTDPERVVQSASIGPSPSTKVASIVPDLSGVTYDPSVTANGYDLVPRTITIAGKPGVLANVSKVPTAIINATGIQGDKTLTVRLIAPAGTMIVGNESVKVTILTVPSATPRTERNPDSATLP